MSLRLFCSRSHSAAAAAAAVLKHTRIKSQTSSSLLLLGTGRSFSTEIASSNHHHHFTSPTISTSPATTTTTSSWTSIRIPNREYIEVKGDDTLHFLQALCTNDTAKLKKHGDCIPVAFLNPKGRIIGDALIYYAPDGESNNNSSSGSNNSKSHRVIIESSSPVCQSIYKFLSMYKLKSKVKMAYPSNFFTELVISEKHNAEVLDKYKDSVVLSTKDPRSSSLGTLMVVQASTSAKEKDSMANILQYNRFRMFHAIPEGLELIDRIPIECNLDLLNYISFSKGCYVGQELTARTKFKGIVRKRLFPFLTLPYADSVISPSSHFAEISKDVLMKVSTISKSYSKSDLPALTNLAKVFVSKEESKNIDNAVGEIVSVATSQDVGLVMLKLDNAIGSANNEKRGESFFVNVENGSNFMSSIKVFRPRWWVDIDPVTGKALVDSEKKGIE